MYEAWVERLRPHVRGARALEMVCEIARHHRIQSSPGYDDAAAWLVTALERAGIEHEVVRVPGDGRTAFHGCVMPQGWACDRAVADLAGAGGRRRVADFAAEPLSLVQRSTSVQGRFALVAVARGDRDADYEGLDVTGRVVVTEGPVQRVHEMAVVRRGAAGLLAYGRRLVPPARTRDDDRDSIAYTSFWWGGDEPRGWGFVVSPALGGEIANRLAEGERLWLEADIRSRRFDTTIPLVSARLPGSRPGEVLLTAHLCHPRPGANDNASGVAAVLEAMRALAAAELPAARRTVRALWMPEFTGTYAWLGSVPSAPARTVAALNLDMVGEDQEACRSVQCLERAPHFAASFADELAREIRATAAPAGLRAQEVPYSGGSDHAVWLDPAIGVPCPMLIQWPDRYYHSSLDGPERVDPRSLAHAALTAAAYAATLAVAGAETLESLALVIERQGVRRMRLALDAAEPAAAARAARARALTALASLARLVPGAPDEAPAARALERAVTAGAEAIEGAWEGEIAPALPPAPAAPAPSGARRVPVRVQRAPLAPMRSLQAGVLALEGAAREALDALDRDFPGGSVAMDLAWFACDGVRDLAAIATCVTDEGAECDAGALAALFEFAVAIGAAAWREG